MRSTRLTTIAALACSLSMGAFAQTVAAANPPAAPAPSVPTAVTPTGTSKVAIINFQAAVFNTNEGKKEADTLTKRFEPKQTELKGMNDQIDSLKKQLQASGDKLSEAERAKRVAELDAKQKQFQRNYEDAQNEFQQALGEIQQKLMDKVGKVMVQYAQNNGYGLVVDYSQQNSPVLWAAPSTDITQAVVEAYNAQSGVAAPAPSAPSATRPAGTRPAAPAASGGAAPQH